MALLQRQLPMQPHSAPKGCSLHICSMQPGIKKCSCYPSSLLVHVKEWPFQLLLLHSQLSLSWEHPPSLPLPPPPPRSPVFQSLAGLAILILIA